MRFLSSTAALVASLSSASCSGRDRATDAQSEVATDSIRILFYTPAAMPAMEELARQPTTSWSSSDNKDSIIVALDGVSTNATATLTLSIGVRHVFVDDSGPPEDSASVYQPRWLQWKTTAPLRMVKNPALTAGRQVFLIVPSVLLAEARRLGARSDESVVSVRVRAEIPGVGLVVREIQVLPSI